MTRTRQLILYVVAGLVIGLAAVGVRHLIDPPEPIDNRCLAALLLVDPDDRAAIPDRDLQAKCPGAERFGP